MGYKKPLTRELNVLCCCLRGFERRYEVEQIKWLLLRFEERENKTKNKVED